MVTVIENLEGLTNIDAIATTPGIDVIFIGASDFALSFTERGIYDAPVVQEAATRIVEAARHGGKAVGMPAVTREDLKQRVDEGPWSAHLGTENYL